MKPDETMSDHQAAQRIGFPLRRVRAELDQRGLCLKIGNRPVLCSKHT